MIQKNLIAKENTIDLATAMESDYQSENDDTAPQIGSSVFLTIPDNEVGASSQE
jgi:hypothetical protein